MLLFALVFLAQLPPHIAANFDPPVVVATSDGHMGAAVLVEVQIIHGEGEPPGPDQIQIRVGESDLMWRRPITQEPAKAAVAAVSQLEKAGVPAAAARTLVAAVMARSGLVGWVPF